MSVYEFLITVGNATRLCMMNGIWADPDVLGCESQQFVQILSQVTSNQEHIRTDS